MLDVYGAREDPVPGVTGALVAERFTDPAHVDYLPDWQPAADRVGELAREGDLVMTLSCGDVYRIIPQLLDALEQRARMKASRREAAAGIRPTAPPRDSAAPTASRPGFTSPTPPPSVAARRRATTASDDPIAATEPIDPATSADRVRRRSGASGRRRSPDAARRARPRRTLRRGRPPRRA